MTPITIPPAAAQRIAAIADRRAAVEQELSAAIDLLRAALDVPDEWQLQVSGGIMAFVPPAES